MIKMELFSLNRIFTDRISTGGNVIGSICLCAAPAVNGQGDTEQCHDPLPAAKVIFLAVYDSFTRFRDILVFQIQAVFASPELFRIQVTFWRLLKTLLFEQSYDCSATSVTSLR